MQQSDAVIWCAAGVWGIVAALIGQLHPWAAFGACFGCCFFLQVQVSAAGARRLLLGAFSWGIGYGAGVFWFGEGPPWSQEAMLVSAAAGALAAVVFTAIHGMVTKDGQLPPWLDSILKLIPWRK